jgi:hypothetical protein
MDNNDSLIGKFLGHSLMPPDDSIKKGGDG